MRKTQTRDSTNVTTKPNSVRRASLCAVSRGMECPEFNGSYLDTNRMDCHEFRCGQSFDSSMRRIPVNVAAVCDLVRSDVQRASLHPNAIRNESISFSSQVTPRTNQMPVVADRLTGSRDKSRHQLSSRWQGRPETKTEDFSSSSSAAHAERPGKEFC